MKGCADTCGISLLNFDGTLQNQPLLHKAYPSEWIDFSDLGGCLGYASGEALRRIRRRLEARRHRRITLIGSGNYHYVTYLLMSEIRQPFSLVLFDHHTDLAPGSPALAASELAASGLKVTGLSASGLAAAVDAPAGTDAGAPVLSCGSWVGAAVNNLPLLRRVVIVGARPAEDRSGRLHVRAHGRTCRGPAPGVPDKVTVITEQEARRCSAGELARAIREALADLPVYISVDKDVLDREHAATNWDQGSMPLGQLTGVLRELKRTCRIAGADVCGELPLSPLERLFGFRTRLVKKNELANKAIVDALLAE